jgi:hypothetical protein
MKRLLTLAVFLCASACCLHAQVVSTTVCDILKNPVSFNNKMVSIKGTVSVGLDFFEVKDLSCGLNINAIWISYPQKSKGKAGPPAVVILQPARNFAGTVTASNRIPVSLQKDGEFKKFDSLLSDAHDVGNGMCLGCINNDVSATLVGRIDAVANAEIVRSGGKITNIGGFGNMGGYPARLVLQSVSDVVAQPIDYKTTDYTKGKSIRRGPTTVENTSVYASVDNPLVDAERFVQGLGGAPGGQELMAAGQVFPQNGKNSGGGVNVTVGYNSLNEDEKYDAQSGEDSPDGVIYQCVFNQHMLPREAIQLGILHIGRHIVEVQTPPPAGTTVNFFAQEHNDWVLTAEIAAGARQNAVALPGSFQLWLKDWSQDQQGNNVDQGVIDYLSKYQGLTK